MSERRCKNFHVFENFEIPIGLIMPVGLVEHSSPDDRTWVWCTDGQPVDPDTTRDPVIEQARLDEQLEGLHPSVTKSEFGDWLFNEDPIVRAPTYLTDETSRGPGLWFLYSGVQAVQGDTLLSIVVRLLVEQHRAELEEAEQAPLYEVVRTLTYCGPIAWLKQTEAESEVPWRGTRAGEGRRRSISSSATEPRLVDDRERARKRLEAEARALGLLVVDAPAETPSAELPLSAFTPDQVATAVETVAMVGRYILVRMGASYTFTTTQSRLVVTIDFEGRSCSVSFDPDGSVVRSFEEEATGRREARSFRDYIPMRDLDTIILWLKIDETEPFDDIPF
jgi:hypothetical protein